MGELLLCNEAIAAMPYYIEGVSINVYSIEELNYYIINNTYLLDDDFMSLELCTWIENHAHLPKLAMHLRTIISTNGRLSAFVTELLEYSGYCTKEELKNTHDALKELEEKSEFECLKIRADRLMEKKKYTAAIFEYKEDTITLLQANKQFSDRFSIGDTSQDYLAKNNHLIPEYYIKQIYSSGFIS